MKQLIITTYLVLSGIAAFAQQEKKYIHQGNEWYKQRKYAEAEASYRNSVEKAKSSIAGNFNLGDALYKQKKFDNAAQKFTEIAASSGNKQVRAQAYHNLGNSLLEAKKLEESIEAYKKSLLNNPKDDQTRYNLAYAQEKLKQQQQQDKNDKNKDKDKKNQDKNKDQRNKDQKDQDKQDQKDQDKKDKDKQDQDKKDQDQKDQQGQQPQPNQLSKEDAERMLEALKNEEKNTQDKLKNKKAKGVKGRIVKDW
ncbi:tetratricopeptide repeat protein [Pedobacter heparinus]|uniref:tetratricopeptide repeat protein n=1 Tax=Pedobacter heparinus TaxID=984 RepID=UPI0029314D8D|nr:tetratricopeptide repeat protein [Pedobacter heparinus]